MTGADLWWLTLGAGTVVTGIVGILLVAILRSVRRIRDNLDAAWTTGQSIARNTVHIDLLRRMGVVADDVNAKIEASAARIGEKADKQEGRSC